LPAYTQNPGSSEKGALSVSRHDQTELLALGSYIGKEVRDDDGKLLGHVWDCILDTGRGVTSVVVSIEGLASKLDTASTGYKFIIPAAYFTPSADRSAIKADVASSYLRRQDSAYFTTGDGIISVRFKQIAPGLGYRTLRRWVEVKGPYGPVGIQ
jgi:sporulation protein YlmC with PRC-barrel domain